MKKTSLTTKMSVVLSIMAIIAIAIYTTNKGMASGTVFSYNVGSIFVVDGYTFKIVDKANRLAVATDTLITGDWGLANDFATGFGQKYSYIRSSGLPGFSNYNDPTFRTNVGNLTTAWEWTSTPFPNNSGYLNRYYAGNSSGGGGLDAGNVYRIRPALYLKSGLYISGTTLYEPLPGTFGDLNIQ